MPYKSPNEVAEKVRGTEKLSEKQRRQFQHVFNSCWDKHGDDALCHKMAWGAVKKSSINWEEMNRRQQRRRDPEGIATEDEAIRGLFMAFADIEAADRIAMGIFDEAKVKKLKARVVDFLHTLGDFRDEMASLIDDLTSAVRNKQSLKEFPELRDILALGNAMRQVRLAPRDVESRIVRVVTVDANS